MKKLNVKERIHNFYEENKVVCNIAGAAGLMAIGSVIGWKYCCKVNKPDFVVRAMVNKPMKDCLNHAFEAYRGKDSSGFAIYGYGPIKLEDMGKLADIARESNFNMNQELTHIIALGLPFEE